MAGRVALLILIAGLAITLTVALLSGDERTEPRYQTVDQVTPDLTGADRRLKMIAAQANFLLPGEVQAFDARRKELKGLPIVVNKWAHWCGPCRAEFPIFQEAAKELGAEVAFLGVNFNDSRSAAAEFLSQYPVPFPSYFDPNLRIDSQLPPAGRAPITNIYDDEGRLVYVETGPFESVDDLKEKLRRYAGVEIPEKPN